MKYLISLLVVCLGAGCAARKEPSPQSAAVVPGTSVPAKRMASVRTPEVVKAYPAGRYTDPNFPDEMHEQHTVYRREQSPDWNYLPDPPPAFPSGNASHYADASGQLNAQQRAYAEALQEQNRAMQKRVEELQQQAGQVPGLQQEIEQLKKQINETSKPEPTPEPATEPATENDAFSSAEPGLPAWEEESENFLFSQMRLNDLFASHLAAAERRKVSGVLNSTFLRSKEFAFLHQ